MKTVKLVPVLGEVLSWRGSGRVSMKLFSKRLGGMNTNNMPAMLSANLFAYVISFNLYGGPETSYYYPHSTGEKILRFKEACPRARPTGSG